LPTDPTTPFTSRVLTVAAAGHPTPLLAVALSQGDAALPVSLEPLDTQASGALRRLLASGDFRGKKDETALIHPDGPAARILLVGMGKADQVTIHSVRRAAAVAAKRARTIGVERMSWILSDYGPISATNAAQAAAEGLAQGAWVYSALKRPPEEPKPLLVEVELLATADVEAAQAGHATGAAIGAGHQLARDLQVLPGNICTPALLAEQARLLADRHGMKVTILDRAALETEGMHALLAVGQGSAQESRFIALEYQGGKGKPVVLIGKGVTFDTGGISIKPAPQMEDMKFDMSGAAAVLGTFEMLGRLKPKLNVIGLIPSAENMLSSTAYKPGDVVRSHFGKTIEVINTDAEGRLLLADALSYARRYDPACVVDAATLTGAVVIGLGHVTSGVLGTDEDLIAELTTAGQRAHERVWELPLWDEYRDLIKSDIADVKNSGGRAAGTITAAWFLREFVDGYPWAHVDIAGTAYTDREDPAQSKGPTGMGVRLFSEFLLARAG
jgi:leucyl aminopeptidase